MEALAGIVRMFWFARQFWAGVLIGPWQNVVVGEFRELIETALFAEPPMTVETIKKLVEDANTKLVRDLSAKSAILSLSMSSITTKVADDVLKMAGFSVVDGSEVEPAGEVSVSEEWKFDMG